MSSNDQIQCSFMCCLTTNKASKYKKKMAHLVLHPWSVIAKSSCIQLNQHKNTLLWYGQFFAISATIQMPTKLCNVIKWFLCLNVNGILPIKYSLMKILNHQNLAICFSFAEAFIFYWTYYEWCTLTDYFVICTW